MKAIPVIAVFDIGKTNKKLLLFDIGYRLVHEEIRQLPETHDEDGDPCEDLLLLRQWVLGSLSAVASDTRFSIKAVQVSAYGASLVYLDGNGREILPLYNYLKPYPAAILDHFYRTYGDELVLSAETASPPLKSLNSGLQLYRIKHARPALFQKIHYALHLPQYISYLLSGALNSEITSTGCHTLLWDFREGDYHRWVKLERLDRKFPAIVDSDAVAGFTGEGIPVGVGLHDSSAALVPYLRSFSNPFLLLSTGTWNISLNPFNTAPLTATELQHDCLCYLTYRNSPVKASRLFAGHEHEQAIRRLADTYGKALNHYLGLSCDTRQWRDGAVNGTSTQPLSPDYETAYLDFMDDLVARQVESTRLALGDTGVRQIFVDGGFSQNPVFMQLLSRAFSGFEVYAATVPHASALGAAMCFHEHWNTGSLPTGLIQLMRYAP